MATTTTIKQCALCGMDVNGQKRVKDTTGSYFCHTCWASARQGHAVAPSGSETVNIADSGKPERPTPSAMRWTIVGCDRESGEEVELTIDAASDEDASSKASQRGILVSKCRPAEIPLASEPVKKSAPPPPRPSQRPPSKPVSPSARLAAQPTTPVSMEIADESLPELPVAVPRFPSGFGNLSVVLKVHPLVGTAGILQFVWAGLMLLIGMIQIGNSNGLLGAWNILVAAAYIVIGIGLIQGRTWAWSWAIGSNMLNALTGIYQIVTEQIWLLGLLLIVEVLVIIFMWVERDLFSKPRAASAPAGPAPTSTAWNRFMRGGLLGVIDERFCTLSNSQDGIIGKTRGQKITRLTVIIAASVGGFVALIAAAVWISELTSSHSSSPSSPSHGVLHSDDDVPPVTVSGPFADKVSFSNWRWDEGGLVGEMRFTGDSTIGFGGCRYRVLKDGVVEDSNQLENPEGRAGESLRVRLSYPSHDRSGLTVEIITQFGGIAPPS
jgi:hypothetical protein